MIQPDDIAQLVEQWDSIEGAALRTLIQTRFFERVITQSQLNVIRDWRGGVPDDRIKLLNEHATLQTFCESFISLGEILRNEAEQQN